MKLAYNCYHLKYHQNITTQTFINLHFYFFLHHSLASLKGTELLLSTSSSHFQESLNLTFKEKNKLCHFQKNSIYKLASTPMFLLCLLLKPQNPSSFSTIHFLFIFSLSFSVYPGFCYIKFLRNLWASCVCHKASLVTQLVKNPYAMWETWVQSLCWEIPWRREWLPTHSSILAWRLPKGGCKESGTTEQISLSLTPSDKMLFNISFLDNPMSLFSLC